eukprot:Lithocolla_globosa_v1_NODE_583_length_3681_cov_15.345284.p4 type:complete len:125 gc:universal NODE_583_length_3681_cov_15.345284:3148-3522(+)
MTGETGHQRVNLSNQSSCDERVRVDDWLFLMNLVQSKLHLVFFFPSSQLFFRKANKTGHQVGRPVATYDGGGRVRWGGPCHPGPPPLATPLSKSPSIVSFLLPCALCLVTNDFGLALSIQDPSR